MLNTLRIFLPHSLPPVLFLLFLLWRLSDGDSMVVPIDLHISSSSQQLYRHYLTSTCREAAKKEFDRGEYLNWEENAFLQQLRITLAEETADGDLSSLYGRPEFKIFDYRILSAKETSKCKAISDKNLREIEARNREKTIFEDEVMNRIFSTPDHMSGKNDTNTTKDE